MITEKDAIYRRFYADPKHDKTTQFFTMIRAGCGPSSRVLNLGAGPTTGNAVCLHKGEVEELVGADIDPAVLGNTEIDRAIVITEKLPFPDDHFDLAFSDCVVEHVEKPAEFLAEVYRVLKPGASYYFRTPNIFHYVALIARATPHWFHELVANRARGLTDEESHAYPTFYRLNSRRKVRRVAAAAGFSSIEITMVEGHPSYLVFHKVPFLAGVAYERLVNSTERLSEVRANIIARLVK